MNRIFLLGNVGGDPVLRYTAAGTPAVSVNVATSQIYKDRSGERKEQTSWFRVNMYSKRAQWVSENVRRGDQVFVEGTCSVREFEGKTGPKTSVEIMADNFTLLTRRDKPKAVEVAEAGIDEEAHKKIVEQAFDSFEAIGDVPF